MHLRALIVLLLVMNLGVALWWGLRPPPGPEPEPALPADVPRLQLVSEATPEALATAARHVARLGAATAAMPVAAEPETAAPPPEGLRCFSLGPWDDPAQAGVARAVLSAQAMRSRERQAAVGARGWRVMLPPLASREAARSTVARLQDAGFDDHFIIGEGAEANAIALGRFSAEARARSHAATLREAGFDAVAEPLQAAGSRTWIDLAAGADFDVDAARAASGASRAEPIDCARLE